MNKVALILGTNEGELLRNLKVARNHIADFSTIEKSSGIYETAPWGKPDQPDFLNQVIQVTTKLNATDLMDRILEIELLMGRKRKVKWESRLIDIDILYFNDEIIHAENITIPHKHLHERRFVLEPLAEIIPDQIHPVLKKSNVELLMNLKDDLNVHLFQNEYTGARVHDGMKRLKYDYIVVEGNIGSGKTSLATKLSNDFNTRLILERFAENPFLPLFYNQPVRYAFALELSFLADRYHQLNEELKSHELFKQQTISDYILSKSLIFANITLQDDENKLYQRLFHIINPHLPKPDLLIFLHKDIDKLTQNIKQRGRSYEQKIEPEYLLKLEKGYWEFLKQLQDTRILVIDSNEIDFVNNHDDYERLLELIQGDFTKGIHRMTVDGRRLTKIRWTVDG